MANKTAIGIAFIAAALSTAPAVQGAPASATVEEITAKDFDSNVLENEKPYAVMFYTEGCPYCRRMEPIFANICRDMQDEIDCGKYDADQEHDVLRQRYHLDGVPIFGFFRDGEPDPRWLEGAVPGSVLRERIEEFTE